VSQPDFLAAFEHHLQLHGVPFERRSVQAFVESAWPLIVEDPTPSRWCVEYLALVAVPRARN
jgi:hypothetical protein